MHVCIGCVKLTALGPSGRERGSKGRVHHTPDSSCELRFVKESNVGVVLDHIGSGYGKDFGLFAILGLVHPSGGEHDMHEPDGASFLPDPVGATALVALGISNPSGGGAAEHHLHDELVQTVRDRDGCRDQPTVAVARNETHADVVPVHMAANKKARTQ